MAETSHVEILDRGVDEWNRWRNQNPQLKPDLSNSNLINRDLSRADLSGANLSAVDLSKAQLSHASLHGANLESSTLILADLLGAILNECNLSAASLFGAFLFGTRLKGANLSGANLMGTSLMGADLSTADLTGAHLMGANFHDANLTKADLSGANLSAASLVGAKVTNATFANSSVYGLSAFNLEGTPAKQSNLVITPVGESAIAVDDLEVAQFIYLLISGGKIPLLLEKVQSRFVLVLGNFKAEREGVLETIRCTLQKHEYTSIVAHFNPPVHRDLTRHIQVLSRFVRFVVADLTAAKPLLQILQHSSFGIPELTVQPLIQDKSIGEIEFGAIGGDSSVREPLPYQGSADLQEHLDRKFSQDLS